MNTFPGVPVNMLLRKHVISAHGEPYKILFPNLRKGKLIDGYLQRGLIYLPEYEARHNELAALIPGHKTPVTDEQRKLIADYIKKNSFLGFKPKDAIEQYLKRIGKET